MLQFLDLLGIAIDVSSISIILPLGISFYTFQSMSYSIDIYRRKIDATTDWVGFYTFVAFFPQLVAGPIEKARDLLPQFDVKRTFNHGTSIDGCKLFLWGLFTKVVIADQVAPLVNQVFAQHQSYGSTDLFLAMILFSIQIYADFSGYSNMAIGSAKLFGIHLSKNFNNPFFSLNIADFWRKWHITLTNWFKDYLYIPLGGSKTTQSKVFRNVLVVFLISGLWHGANWTFVIWGLLHAILFLPLIFLNKNRAHIGVVAPGSALPSIIDLGRMVTTFLLVSMLFVFFRAESIQQSFEFLTGIFRFDLKSQQINLSPLLSLSILFTFLMEWIYRAKPHTLDLSYWPRFTRWGLYYLMILTIIYCFRFAEPSEFIYFQF